MTNNIRNEQTDRIIIATSSPINAATVAVVTDTPVFVVSTAFDGVVISCAVSIVVLSICSVLVVVLVGSVLVVVEMAISKHFDSKFI